MVVAYNPNDPLQTSFLTGINKAEGSPGPQQGYNYVPLAGYPTNQYGFPAVPSQPGPAGPTTPAGSYQFEPATWNSIASQYGLNFQNPADQSAAAWYNAQAADPNLYAQLQAGDIGGIQSNPALNAQWPTISSSAFASGFSTAQASGGIDPSNTTAIFGDAPGSNDPGLTYSCANCDTTVSNGSNPTSSGAPLAGPDQPAGSGDQLPLSDPNTGQPVQFPGATGPGATGMSGLAQATGVSQFFGNLFTDTASLFVRFGLVLLGIVLIGVAAYFFSAREARAA